MSSAIFFVYYHPPGGSIYVGFNESQFSMLMDAGEKTQRLGNLTLFILISSTIKI